MVKRIIIAIVVVFFAWGILNFIMHGVILTGAYQATPSLWRPMAEMKMGLSYLVALISASVFVCIYARFVSDKSVSNAVRYGLLYGIGAGISMGYGSYSAMPIPYSIALTWFLGTMVEDTLAGWLMGLIVKPASPPAA